MYAHGGDATQNYDNYQDPGEGKVTFEDIDGFEWFSAAGTDLGYVLIQEDSGSDYGERTLIAELKIGTPLTYYNIAISGGGGNTRMAAGVGIPAGVNTAGGTHEFSGAMDLSGMLAKDAKGKWVINAGDGYAKRQADKAVAINDKIIAFGLQAHNFNSGIMETYKGDRGGAVLAYQPNLPWWRPRTQRRPRHIFDGRAQRSSPGSTPVSSLSPARTVLNSLPAPPPPTPGGALDPPPSSAIPERSASSPLPFRADVSMARRNSAFWAAVDARVPLWSLLALPQYGDWRSRIAARRRCWRRRALFPRLHPRGESARTVMEFQTIRYPRGGVGDCADFLGGAVSERGGGVVGGLLLLRQMKKLFQI